MTVYPRRAGASWPPFHPRQARLTRQISRTAPRRSAHVSLEECSPTYPLPIRQTADCDSLYIDLFYAERREVPLAWAAVQIGGSARAWRRPAHVTWRSQLLSRVRERIAD
jgi:hypothetical protein